MVKKKEKEEKKVKKEWKEVDREILWDRNKVEIHPALDYRDGKVYVANYLPVQETITEQKKSSQEPKVIVKEVERCYVITSDREIFLLNEDGNNGELPFYPKAIPQRIRRRWSLESTKDWIEGKAEPVSISDVYEEMKEEREFYMDYHVPIYSKYYALRNLSTYFHPIFKAFPIAYLRAIKRAGKTKDMTISSLVSFNGYLFQSPSESAIFRLSHANRCAIYIDEVKKLHPNAEQNLKDIIKGKYKKGVSIPRVEEKRGGKGWEVRDYEIYGPLTIANIKGVESDMEDRSIPTIHRRTRDKVKGNREIDFTKPIWQEIRDDAYICLLTQADKVYKALNEVNLVVEARADLVEAGRGFNDKIGKKDNNKKEVQDKNTLKNQFLENSLYQCLLSTKLQSRELELWRPILVLAGLISEELLKEMLEFAEETSKKKTEEDTSTDKDISFIRGLIEYLASKASTTKKVFSLETGREVEAKEAILSNSDFLQFLRDRYLSDYPDEEITPQWIGNQFKKFGIAKTKSIHGLTHYVVSPDEVDGYALTISLNPDEIREEYLEENGDPSKVTEAKLGDGEET